MQDIDRSTVILPPTVHSLVGQGYVRIKRVLDVALVLLFLPLLAVLMVLIAIAIKVYSPGPIFYRQQRIGRAGQPFEMLKFRSMHVGSSTASHRAFVQQMIRENLRPEDVGLKVLKLPNDTRITKPGKLLRSLSLDELPQFINVLRGEMSIVGPRPPLPYEYEIYSEWHRHRLDALPGITGLWQVTAHNQVSFDEMVQLDLDYIASMSPWLDLKIMLMTPVEMLRAKGGS